MHSFETVWQKALDLLNYRALSENEMRQRLSQKFPQQKEAMESAIMELKRLELLNDQRYLELYVKELTRKPIGLYKILFFCRRRGLREDQVRAKLSEIHWSEQESLEQALKEKKEKLQKEDAGKSLIKLTTFLNGRGFSRPLIYQAIRSLKDRQ